MKKVHSFLLLIAAAVLFLSDPITAHAQAKVPVILDTDIGSDIDDAFALGLLLASPEVDLRGVTTCASDPDVRAWIVCRFLTAVGKKNIPVAAGSGKQPVNKIEGQFQYRYHPAVIFNRTAKPIKKDAVEFLYEQLKADPGKITVLCTGPLTNIGRLLEKHPECKPWIKQIVISGGRTVPDDAGDIGKSIGSASYNNVLDTTAAKKVFAAGVPVHFLPGAIGAKAILPKPFSQKIFSACTPVTLQVQALYQLWDQEEPILADAVAAALCFENKFTQTQIGEWKKTLSGNAFELVPGKGKDKIITTVDIGAFLPWLTKRLTTGEPALPNPPPNPSKVIPPDLMPNRVHAFENFDTDIEKRWWMSGKLETKIVPPTRKRACRGVLTLDFDDLQGDMKTMYTAVIFNPVPGPPMGKQPRLSFRYWLKGTDTLRVQIYSLTNGYHRCLTLKGLPQEKWQAATVDMTQVRRPDGTGGPLSENERIDDIQFYVDPRAELIIDDIVLYDAPVAGEQRPFPKSILFSALFDTGKQGKEWPGDFEIVKGGYFWNAAKSVSKKETDKNWIRVGLRGPRPLGDATHLFFRYHLTGANAMQVILTDGKNGKFPVNLNNLKIGEWAEITVPFTPPSGAGVPLPGGFAEEIHFLLSGNATLLVDDLLLYEPGKGG